MKYRALIHPTSCIASKFVYVASKSEVTKVATKMSNSVSVRRTFGCRGKQGEIACGFKMSKIQKSRRHTYTKCIQQLATLLEIRQFLWH
jgi:hypothetical protein